MDNPDNEEAKSPNYSSDQKESENNDEKQSISEEGGEAIENINQNQENAEVQKEESNLSMRSDSEKENANEGGMDEETQQSHKVSEITFEKEEAEDQASVSNDEEKKKKHKKKRRSKKHSKHDKIRKKLKTEHESVDRIMSDGQEGGILDSDEDETDGKKRKKTKIKSRKSKKQLEAESCENEASWLISKMEEAFKLDQECLECKQLALNKLRILPEFDKILRKEYVQKNFLDKDGLDSIEKWLRKMPDGSSPSQTLKKKLLEIIHILPVEEDHLKNSKLGRLLYEMQRGTNEDINTKKLLKDIITKWARILLEMPADYAYRREVETERENTVQKIKVNINEETKEMLNLKPVNSTYKSNARVLKSGYDFAKRPQQLNLEKIQRADKNTHTDEFERALVDIKKKMKLGSRKV